MYEEMFDNNPPRIIPRDKIKELGINLNNLEKVSSGETPLLSNTEALKKGLRTIAEQEGASLIILTSEQSYGGTFVDKHKYSYELYKKI